MAMGFLQWEVLNNNFWLEYIPIILARKLKLLAVISLKFGSSEQNSVNTEIYDLRNSTGLFRSSEVDCSQPFFSGFGEIWQGLLTGEI